MAATAITASTLAKAAQTLTGRADGPVGAKRGRGIGGGVQGRASRPEARSTPTEDAKHSAQDSLFEAIDTNRDGTLSAEEFTDFFSARLENGEEPDSLMALFAAIDKDNSGGIDRTEFREGSHLLHSLTCYSSDKHRI